MSARRGRFDVVKGREPSAHTSDRTARSAPNVLDGIVLILLALLLVLLFAGLGFALHVLWVVAAVLLVLWLIGFALGRGESAGSHRFYRW